MENNHELLNLIKHLSQLFGSVEEYGIALLDKEGSILSWNKGAEKVSGYKSKSILNQNFLSLFDKEMIRPNESIQLLEKLEKGKGNEVKSENWFAKSNGAKYWATTTISKLEDHDNYVMIFRDITVKKESYEHTKLSEQSLKIAQKIAKVGSFEWNPVTNEAKWSEEMFEILGMQKEKYSGEAGDIFDFIHPEDVAEVQKATAKAIETKQGVPVEYRIVTSSGELKHIYADGLGVYDDNGNMVAMYGTIQDITERRLLKEQVDSFFQFSLELHCIATPHGQFIRLNPAWEEVLGFTEAELLKMSFFDLIHPDDIDSTMKEAANLTDPSHKTISFINRYRTKSGKYRWFEWTSGVVPTTGLLMATARDITDKIEREKELKSYNDELERKNRELAQFAYVSSHDLQEPLKTVRSFANLLSNDFYDELSVEAKDSIRFIQSAVGRMEKLVGGLLDYSRIGQSAKREKVCVEEVIQTVLDDLQKHITDVSASVKVGKMPKIEADPLELRLIFQNLISNAIKFVPKGEKPVVSITAKKEDKFYRFSISDNGIGIDPKFFERIFLIFQRLHTRKEYAGTGIGLAHVKKIINIYGGDIWIESKVDTGSTFHFTLPI